MCKRGPRRCVWPKGRRRAQAPSDPTPECKQTFAPKAASWDLRTEYFLFLLLLLFCCFRVFKQQQEQRKHKQQYRMLFQLADRVIFSQRARFTSTGDEGCRVSERMETPRERESEDQEAFSSLKRRVRINACLSHNLRVHFDFCVGLCFVLRTSRPDACEHHRPADYPHAISERFSLPSSAAHFSWLPLTVGQIFSSFSSATNFETLRFASF